MSNPEGNDRSPSEVIEAIVDACTLQGTLELLSAVCRDKAEHLRHTWQEPHQARSWDHLAGSLDRCARKAERRSL